MRTLVLGLTILATACGGASTSNATPTAAASTAPGNPRPGGPVDLVALVPAEAVVALHADLSMVRQDPARYARISGELATHLGLTAESETLRALLDRTDAAVGAFLPDPGVPSGQGGMLVFTGRYGADDFERALAIAAARHGSTPPPTTGPSGRAVYALGDATLAEIDEWTWALGQGPAARAHLAQVALGGPRVFPHSLLEFGPRIGLPNGSAQAWADQNSPVGVDMVGLVFAGENPQMVQNFVATVQRHLGI
ncbi:MAG: hypothetical protein RLO52_42015 [Sandaracinaceae bacterium]